VVIKLSQCIDLDSEKEVPNIRPMSRMWVAASFFGFRDDFEKCQTTNTVNDVLTAFCAEA